MKKLGINLIFIVFIMLIIINKVYQEQVSLALNTETLYLEDYDIVEKSVIKESIISYLYKDKNNRYLSKIYDYKSKEEMNIEDLVKEEYIDEYYQKINELIYLKYPKFIADILINNRGSNAYLFKDNEVIIYFNDYEIEIDEVLYLKVNYNEIYKYLNITVSLDKEYQNESGYDYQKDKKTVAFTFDDSPNEGKTDVLVDILKENYAHATFFMVGEKMETNNFLVELVYKSGNEIGSHTYRHQNLKRLTPEEIKTDYEKVNNIYNEITHDTIKLFRPPYGSIKDESLGLLNVSYILWNIDTLDWKIRNKDYIINNVLDNIQDGDIILFHDSYESTIQAVKELLPLLYLKGYQVVSVSELAQLKNQPLEVGVKYNNFK